MADLTMIEQANEGVFHTNRWDDLMQARNAVHTDCYDNSAAMYGDVFTTWDDTFHRYLDALHNYPRDEVLFDINKIVPMMLARDAFIMGDGMTIYTHSTSDETIGTQRARKAQQIARAHWEQHDMWSKYLAVREWGKICGTSFMRIYYDPSAGNKIKGSRLFEGEVKALPLSLWQVAWDPFGDEWDQVGYAYIASLKPVEQLEARGLEMDWGLVMKDDEKKAWISQHELYINAQKPELAHLNTNRDSKGRKRNVLVLEYFEKPSKAKPQGEYAVIIGQKIVRKTPLEVGMIPIIPFYDTRKAGTILSETPVKRMRPLQEAIDHLASNLLKRSMLPDIYSFPDSLGWPTNPRKFAGKAFILGEHRSFGPSGGSAEPKYLSCGQIRQDFMMLFNLFEGEMEKLAGVSSLATAQPKGEWSGRFGYIVNEANKKLLSKISYEFKKSVEQTERLILMFVNKYYTEERTAQYINESDMREIVRYKGSDIGTDWTIEVSLQSNLMDDPMQIAQMTLQYLSIPLIAQQVINNPVALKKATEMINPEFAQKMFSAEQDTGVAEDENFEIKQGGTPQVMPWQVDDVHLREHTRQRNSDEILTWRPEAVRYLEIHMEKHEEQKASKMARQAMMMNMFAMGQGAMGGGAGGRAGGVRPQGSPGIAPAQTRTQSIDTSLERATRNEYPNAPSPGQQSGGFNE